MRNLLLVALCIVATNAMICTRNICSKMKCEVLTVCNGRVTKGPCGCCRICVVSLSEGEKCSPYAFSLLAIHSECRPPLKCNTRIKVCYKPLGRFTRKCARDKQEVMLGRRPGPFTSKCDDYGHYEPVQCNETRCKCVTLTGVEVPGFSGRVGYRMNCRCALDQYSYSSIKNRPRVFRCKSNGDYEKVQCWNRSCFCANKFGKPKNRKRLPYSQKHRINC